MSLASRAVALLQKQYEVIYRRMHHCQWLTEFGPIINLCQTAVQKLAMVKPNFAVAPMEALEPRTLLSATLLKDINDGGLPFSTAPVAVGGTLYFVNTDPNCGSSLWKTDGTATGATLVKDLNPGVTRADIANLTNLNGVLYFTASDDLAGNELWKSDGTASGTVRVKDIYEGANSSTPTNLTNVNGTLYFLVTGQTGYTELWKSNGTDGGTARVKTFDSLASSAKFRNFTDVNGTLYYTIATDSFTTQLWKSDGTEAGTTLIKQFSRQRSDVDLSNLINVNGTLFFSGEDSTGGIELWKSNGTAAGTIRVKDIYAGAMGSSPSNFVNVGGTLYFTAADSAGGAELWKSTGTDAGTVRVKDIYSGTAGSSPSNLININGTLYFAAADSAGGMELWKSNGTATGTVRVKDIVSGTGGSNPGDLRNVNGVLYFTATDGTSGTELWKSDGTAAGTIRVKDLTPGTASTQFAFMTATSTALFFQVKDSLGHYNLWKSNGTDASTLNVTALSPGAMHAAPQDFFELNGFTYFVAKESSGYFGLWRTDGTTAGTLRIKLFNVGESAWRPTGFVKVKNVVYFQGSDSTYGYELWKTDGTDAGTVRVKDIYAGSGSSWPEKLTDVNGTLYFIADSENGKELWKSDGTAAGTVLVKDICVGADGSFPGNLTNVNGILYFIARDNNLDTELWKSDGTTAGTVRVKDIFAGTSSSVPANLTNVNGTLYFTATDEKGTELWKSDGTEAGTVRVKDIAAGASSSSPSALKNVNGVVYFLVAGSIWKSDGTETGTINTGITTSAVSSLSNVNGALYFFDTAPFYGKLRLWKSDGTVAGRVLLKEFANAYSNFVNQMGGFTEVNGAIYFAGPSDSAISELWQSDGTSSGTNTVKDSSAGLAIMTPGTFRNYNGKLLFVGDDGVHGTEVWAIEPPLAAIAQASVVEGSNVTLDASGSISQSPSETLTYAWDLDGDGVFGETGSAARQGDEIGRNPIFSAVGLDGTGLYNVSLRVTSSSGLISIATRALSIVNVAPTITLSGDSTVNEGTGYTLTLGPVLDAGQDTVSQYIINWGDGQISTIAAADLPANRQISHVYADGTSAGLVRTIQVSLVDEDGTYSNIASKNVTVGNVNPSVVLIGNETTDERSTYVLAITTNDPGQDTITQYIIDWGDGQTDTYTDSNIPANRQVTHVYATGTVEGISRTIHVSLKDEDGDYIDLGSKAVTVKRVAPTLAISGDASVNEGAPYELTLSEVSSAGTGTINEYTIDWGDGQSSKIAAANLPASRQVQHIYKDGTTAGVSRTIKVTLKDENGIYTDVASTIVEVKNIAPTLALIGSNKVNEGDLYALTLGPVSDPGQDSISQYVIDWGDGQSSTIAAADLPVGRQVTHVYADGTATGTHRTINITMTDEDGTYTNVATWAISVKNVSPIARFVNTGPVLQGQSATVRFADLFDQSEADGGAGLHFSIALNSDDLATDYASAIDDAAKNFVFTANGAYRVYGRIFDKDGGYTDYMTTISVCALGPTNLEISSLSVAENTVPGATIATLNSNDLSSDVLTYSLVAGDGSNDNSCFIIDGNQLKANTSFNHLLKNSYTIRVRVTDADGLSLEKSFSISVNVAPTATIHENAANTNHVGVPLRFDSQVDDPNSADVFTYAWSVMSGSAVVAAGSDSSFIFTPDNAGTYTVTLVVTDNHGVSSAATSRTINVVLESGLPKIADLHLANDTGVAGDNQSSDPTIKGQVQYDGPTAYLPVQFDLNGDGVAEGTGFADGSGAFELNLKSFLNTPQILTVRVRAGRLDRTTGGYVYGDWQSLNFTYQAADSTVTVVHTHVPSAATTAFSEQNFASWMPVFNTDGASAFNYSVDNLFPDAFSSYLSRFDSPGTSSSSIELDDDPTASTYTYTNSLGQFTITTVDLYSLTKSAIFGADNNWSYHEVLEASYRIDTVFTGLDGSSWKLTQIGSDSYTLTATGLLGGSSSYNSSRTQSQSYVYDWQNAATDPAKQYHVDNNEERTFTGEGTRVVNGEQATTHETTTYDASGEKNRDIDSKGAQDNVAWIDGQAESQTWAYHLTSVVLPDSGSNTGTQIDYTFSLDDTVTSNNKNNVAVSEGHGGDLATGLDVITQQRQTVHSQDIVGQEIRDDNGNRAGSIDVHDINKVVYDKYSNHSVRNVNTTDNSAPGISITTAGHTDTTVSRDQSSTVDNRSLTNWTNGKTDSFALTSDQSNTIVSSWDSTRGIQLTMVDAHAIGTTQSFISNHSSTEKGTLTFQYTALNLKNIDAAGNITTSGRNKTIQSSSGENTWNNADSSLINSVQVSRPTAATVTTATSQGGSHQTDVGSGSYSAYSEGTIIFDISGVITRTGLASHSAATSSDVSSSDNYTVHVVTVDTSARGITRTDESDVTMTNEQQAQVAGIYTRNATYVGSIETSIENSSTTSTGTSTSHQSEESSVTVRDTNTTGLITNSRITTKVKSDSTGDFTVTDSSQTDMIAGLTSWAQGHSEQASGSVSSGSTTDAEYHVVDKTAINIVTSTDTTSHYQKQSSAGTYNLTDHSTSTGNSNGQSESSHQMSRTEEGDTNITSTSNVVFDKVDNSTPITRKSHFVTDESYNGTGTYQSGYSIDEQTRNGAYTSKTITHDTSDDSGESTYESTSASEASGTSVSGSGATQTLGGGGANSDRYHEKRDGHTVQSNIAHSESSVSSGKVTSSSYQQSQSTEIGQQDWDQQLHNITENINYGIPGVYRSDKNTTDITAEGSGGYERTSYRRVDNLADGTWTLDEKGSDKVLNGTSHTMRVIDTESHDNELQSNDVTISGEKYLNMDRKTTTTTSHTKETEDSTWSSKNEYTNTRSADGTTHTATTNSSESHGEGKTDEFSYNNASSVTIIKADISGEFHYLDAAGNDASVLVTSKSETTETTNAHRSGTGSYSTDSVDISATIDGKNHTYNSRWRMDEGTFTSTSTVDGTVTASQTAGGIVKYNTSVTSHAKEETTPAQGGTSPSYLITSNSISESFEDGRSSHYQYDSSSETANFKNENSSNRTGSAKETLSLKTQSVRETSEDTRNESSSTTGEYSRSSITSSDRTVDGVTTSFYKQTSQTKEKSKSSLFTSQKVHLQGNELDGSGNVVFVVNSDYESTYDQSIKDSEEESSSLSQSNLDGNGVTHTITDSKQSWKTPNYTVKASTSTFTTKVSPSDDIGTAPTRTEDYVSDESHSSDINGSREGHDNRHSENGTSTVDMFTTDDSTNNYANHLSNTHTLIEPVNQPGGDNEDSVSGALEIRNSDGILVSHSNTTSNHTISGSGDQGQDTITESTKDDGKATWTSNNFKSGKTSGPSPKDPNSQVTKSESSHNNSSGDDEYHLQTVNGYESTAQGWSRTAIKSGNGKSNSNWDVASNTTNTATKESDGNKETATISDSSSDSGKGVSTFDYSWNTTTNNLGKSSTYGNEINTTEIKDASFSKKHSESRQKEQPETVTTDPNSDYRKTVKISSGTTVSDETGGTYSIRGSVVQTTDDNGSTYEGSVERTEDSTRTESNKKNNSTTTITDATENGHTYHDDIFNFVETGTKQTTTLEGLKTQISLKADGTTESSVVTGKKIIESGTTATSKSSYKSTTKPDGYFTVSNSSRTYDKSTCQTYVNGELKGSKIKESYSYQADHIFDTFAYYDFEPNRFSGTGDCEYTYTRTKEANADDVDVVVDYRSKIDYFYYGFGKSAGEQSFSFKAQQHMNDSLFFNITDYKESQISFTNPGASHEIGPASYANSFEMPESCYSVGGSNIYVGYSSLASLNSLEWDTPNYSVYDTIFNFVLDTTGLNLNDVAASTLEGAKTFADGFFGATDGFLDTINPFNNWASIPDIGPVFGHETAYGVGQVAGTVAGIAAGLAIGNAAAGACGMAALAAKAYTFIDTTAGVVGAVQNIYNNGSIGIGDALALAPVLSFGAQRLRGVSNQCFTAGTEVLTGTTDQSAEDSGQFTSTKIEDVKVGDWVWTRADDNEDSPLELKQVTAIYRNVVYNLQTVQIQDEEGNIETIHVTDEHPFYSESRGWIGAAQLTVGETIQSTDGRVLTVISNEDEARPEGIVTYNLQIDGDHTYFVSDGTGEDSWAWVHNTCWSAARSKYWQSLAETEIASGSKRFSQNNLELMLKGKAPQILAEIRLNKSGKTVIREISLELHHMTFPQRSGSKLAHEAWNLMPVAPWTHAMVDPYRHTGFELISILKGTMNF